jgi:DNA-binding GntR family transcriptional regulator
MSEALEAGKAPFQVIRRIREAILDGTFEPGDRLLEDDLAERFSVSRSPVREALLALENEGTAIMVPYKGAIVKPLSPEECLGHWRTQISHDCSGGQACTPSSFTG